MKPQVASLYEAVDLDQAIKPLLIGERCNSNGSRRFRGLLLDNDWNACVSMALEQEQSGAHVLDLCSAYAGRDEMADMTTLVKLFAVQVKKPLMMDSTTPEVIEACLALYPGRCIVNSVNLEDGGANLQRVLKAVRRFGAAVVALTIDEQGMAMTAAEKLRIAKRIHTLAVDEIGLHPEDILFDPLTFTIGSGDESLFTAAMETLEGLRLIKRELPGVHTVLGLSNISFGLSPYSRKLLNSVFLHEALEAGMDACIIDAAKVLPLAGIAAEDRELCLNLIYNRAGSDGSSPLLTFISHFSGRAETEENSADKEARRTPEELLVQAVLSGKKDNLEDKLAALLRRHSAVGIINELLIPAMRKVGELFGKGEILLPFVLQSAEVMKGSVRFLEPYMEKKAQDGQLKVLLATVQGDVHDIGKNLVEIILSNNGYKVYNLGIKVPAETIIAKAKETGADIIGLSGLLVKSAMVMQDSLPLYAESGLTVPIFLGGAALTAKFVAQNCVPRYPGPVVYNADAFEGLKNTAAWEAGTLTSTRWDEGTGKKGNAPGRKERISRVGVPVPRPPFRGSKIVTDIPLDPIFDLINTQALFRGRWGYRRGKMAAAEYETLISTRVEPLYRDFVRRSREEQLIQPRVAYGYYRCWSEDDVLMVEDDGSVHPFPFPRQSDEPNLCIADYFRTKDEGGDITSFFVVTVGEKISEATRVLYETDQYHDYLLLHAFGVEVTDALAEYWHKIIRQELGIAGNEPDNLPGYVRQDYQGSRYGFGYPACPDLDAHKTVFQLLRPERIGISLTENMEMVPEQTTSAIVAHHPQAKYFSI